MKFILNEKFILAEPTLKILEERFILNEDGDDLEDTLLGTTNSSEKLLDTAYKLAAKLKDTFKNSKAVLYSLQGETSKESAASKQQQTLLNNIKAAEFEVDISNDLLEMKLDLTQYITALEKALPELNNTNENFKELTEKIKALQTLSGSSKWEKNEINELKQIVTWINKNITTIFKTAHSAESFKEACTECLDLLNNLEKEIPVNLKYFTAESLTQYNDFLTRVIEGITVNINKDEIDDFLGVGSPQYKKILETLKANCVKISESKVLKELKEKAATANKAEDEADSTRDTIKVDWAALYLECGKCSNKTEAYNAFWKGGLPLKGEPNPKQLPIAANEKIKLGYYKGEWGKYASVVESFGTPFIDSLHKEGWSAILNPIVNLLKYLFKFSTPSISEATFSLVLDAYKNSIVSAKDLSGKGHLGEINLVRNPILYTKSSELTDYLRWQRAILSKESSLPEGSSIKTVFANIALSNGLTSKEQLFTSTEALATCTKQPNYSIRPLTEFKELIKSQLDVEAEEKATNATNADLDKILNAIGRNAEKAKKFITYWVSLYRVKNVGLVTELNKKFNNKLIEIRNKNTTSFEEDSGFDSLVTLKTIKYSKAQWESLLEKILELTN